jgi:hypothetical protein
MSRGSTTLGMVACVVGLALTSLGMAPPASASDHARGITAGPVRETEGSGSLLPTAVVCPPGTSPIKATCGVIGTNSFNDHLLESVIHGKPQEGSTGGGFVAGSCASTSRCLFVWSDLELYWSPVTGNPSYEVGLKNATALTGVACESVTTCVVVGTLRRGGTSHGVVAVVTKAEHSPSAVEVPGVAVINWVACASSMTCFAVGSTSTGKNGVAVVVPVVNGKVGGDKQVVGSNALLHISCGAATSCWATGTTTSSNVIVHVNHGTPARAASGFRAKGIACISATTCLIATGTGRHSGPNGVGYGKVDELTDGRLTGDLTLNSMFGGSLTGIACPTSVSCLAAGLDTSQTGAVLSIQI